MKKMTSKKIIDCSIFDASYFNNNYDTFKQMVNMMCQEFEQKFMDLQLPEYLLIKISIEEGKIGDNNYDS